MKPRWSCLGTFKVLPLLLLAQTFSSCSQAAPAFEWEREDVCLGPVFRYSEWSDRVGFKVRGRRSVELVGVRTSCGCVLAEAVLHDGSPLLPGVYPAGTQGSVILRVRPKREKRALDERVPMLWRFEGERDLRFTELRLRGEIVEAWQVEPEVVRLDNVPPGKNHEVELRWRPLTTVAGSPSPVCEGTGVRLVDSPRAIGPAPGNQPEVVVHATIWRPENSYEAAGAIRLGGVEPPAPDVPIHVTFARTVVADPDRVVMLAAQPDGSFSGQVRVRIVDEIRCARELSLRVEIEPTAMAEALEIRSDRVSEREVLLSIFCRRREIAQGRRTGTLVIRHGIERDPPVRLLWYLGT